MESEVTEQDLAAFELRLARLRCHMDPSWQHLDYNGHVKDVEGTRAGSICKVWRSIFYRIFFFK